MKDFKYNSSENLIKFSLFKDRENLKNAKLRSDINEELLKKCTADKIPHLAARISNDLLKQSEKTYISNYPLINYNSISLPKRYVLLDSRNRNLSKSDYSWNLTPFFVAQQGQVNSLDTITQIVEISCQPFRIPIIPGSNMNFYNRVRMGIQEFNGQGISLITNAEKTTSDYYHFEFDAVNNGRFLELTPNNKWRPGKAIALCDNITLSFFGNTEKINFLPDRLLFNVVPGFPAIFTSSMPHNLITGDLIYVSSGELRRNEGYNAIVTSANVFSILETATIMQDVYIYFGNARVQVQLNFVCLEN